MQLGGLMQQRRVLWLLNHKTLAEFEVPLLTSLGFEVFCPKVIPSTGFRSGGVTYAFDEHLTIPKRDLDLLNSFNFYTERWPRTVSAIVNKYFDAAITIPYASQFAQVVERFHGVIALRAFGLENNRTYGGLLRELHGDSFLRKIQRIGDIEDRLWFAEAYSHLHEIETGVLSRRRVFLPIGLPSAMCAHVNTWIGNDERILFVCPDIKSSSYYAEIYRNFKSEFGDLPHIIVGQQEIPVDDPSVSGYVSSARLIELYQSCRAFYYHSTERNHVHYSPLEAAAIGMPIIYRKGSLLHNLAPSVRLGVANDVTEAHRLLEQALEGHNEFIEALRQEQRAIAQGFTAQACSDVWKANLSSSGVLAAIDRKKPKVVNRASKLWSDLSALVRGA